MPKTANGFVKIHRKLTEWEWYHNSNVVRVFLHLLLMANHEDSKWQGIAVKRGQRVTSYEHIATEVGELSVQQVRTALNKLKSTHEITSQSTTEYTIITITNYNAYQENNTRNNKQITNEQQTNNKQITTNKNEKNEKNEKNIYIPKKYLSPQDIKDEDIIEIAEKLGISIKDVRKKHDELIDAVEANPRKYKYDNYKAALRNWTKRAIEDGRIRVINLPPAEESDNPLIRHARKAMGL